MPRFSKWIIPLLKEIPCKCGCGKLILNFGSNSQPRMYVKGHQKSWLGKKRSDMIGNKFSGNSNQEYFKNHKFIGSNHSGWKGDRVGYHALHAWVERNLGKPMKCEKCKLESNNPHKIHWANRSHKYNRDLTDWLRLCAKCHYHYDRE